MWCNLEFNSNNVQSETARSVLIKIPKSEFMFWHPAKLVRYFGKRNYMVSIGYTDDFKFTVFRNGKGRYNSRERIEELVLDASEFVERFFNACED